jgi:phospholipase C
MSNLVNAFDFDNPDYSIPNIPDAPAPSEDSDGNWDSAVLCQGTYGTPPPHPPAPYGPENENLDTATLVENGFKSVRGYLTEGRYLVFEMNGYALTNAGPHGTDITGTHATADHRSINQRWVVHATGGTALDGGEGSGTFVITSAVDGRYIADHTSLEKARSGAETYTITDLGNGLGYSLLKENGKYLSIGHNGKIGIYSTPSGFKVYSVTYQS